MPKYVGLLVILNPFEIEFFQQFLANGIDLPELIMWRAQVVEQELLKSVEQTYLPPQVIVGSDAKFSFLPMRHMPVWLQDLLQSLFILDSSIKPKIMA